MVSVALKDGKLYICWVGRVKTNEEFLLLKTQINNALDKFIHNPNIPPKPDKQDAISTQDSNIKEQKKYDFFRLMLVNSYPFNTHALGFILKLKLSNKYDFDIATDHYRLLSLLENVEFSKIFTLSIDSDPRLTTKSKILDVDE